MQTPSGASAPTPLSASAKKISRLIQLFEQPSPAASPTVTQIGKKRSFIQTIQTESFLPESPPKRQKISETKDTVGRTPGRGDEASTLTTPRASSSDAIGSAQKKKSGVVDKPRMEASFEILTSERSYVDTLDQFVKVRQRSPCSCRINSR